MRKKEELKTIRKSILMTQTLSNDIDREANERGIKANAVMVERLAHSKSNHNPKFMAEFQDFGNRACKEIEKNDPETAKKLRKELNTLWTF